MKWFRTISLVFTSPDAGWMTGNCPGLLPELFLYRTMDGGKNWQQWNLPAPEGQPGNLFEGQFRLRHPQVGLLLLPHDDVSRSLHEFSVERILRLVVCEQRRWADLDGTAFASSQHLVRLSQPG